MRRTGAVATGGVHLGGVFRGDTHRILIPGGIGHGRGNRSRQAGRIRHGRLAHRLILRQHAAVNHLGDHYRHVIGRTALQGHLDEDISNLLQIVGGAQNRLNIGIGNNRVQPIRSQHPALSRHRIKGLQLKLR